MALVIGFSGTFYTLWDVETQKIYLETGRWYDRTICTYYRNLSKNLDEAILKAGTDNVEPSLKGKRKSFEYKSPVKIEPSIMEDREVLFRIILVNNKENTLEARKAALSRMLELGYIKKISGSFEVGVQDSYEMKNCTTCYEVQGNCRFNTVWYHSQLEIAIKGII